MLRAELLGMGLALLPAWLVRPEPERGTLVRVLPGLPMPEATVLAVLPPGRQAPMRVRALLEVLVAEVGSALAQPAPPPTVSAARDSAHRACDSQPPATPARHVAGGTGDRGCV